MNYFEVGHDEGSTSGMKLEELLFYTNNVQFQKIWLDIKNLNDENISAIIQRLTKLDRKFNIREKAIVESSTTSISFAELAKLKPGEIYVSEVIGAYLTSPLIGPYTKTRCLEKGIPCRICKSRKS